MTTTSNAILAYAKKWRSVYVAMKNSLTTDELYAKFPFVGDVFPKPSTSSPAAPDEIPGKGDAGDPLNPSVLAMLEKESGIGSKEAWWNVWWLISKPEHDNERKSGAFDSDNKDISLFEYADALSYDWKERGVTMGLVGFTTAYDGKDAQGDAMGLFKIYKQLGGEDLAPLAVGCTKSKQKCQKLINKIRSIGEDPKWIEAQWRALFVDGGYLRETMKAFKSVGIDKPSALAIATVFDASLNQGAEGPDGGCVYLKKLAVRGNEEETLKKYNQWRRKVAGTNDYNSPAINGQNRADQFEKLRAAKCHVLEKCDGEIKKAISWEMR